MHYETSIEDFEFSSDIKSTRSQDLVEVEKCWPALVVFFVHRLDVAVVQRF